MLSFGDGGAIICGRTGYSAIRGGALQPWHLVLLAVRFSSRAGTLATANGGPGTNSRRPEHEEQWRAGQATSPIRLALPIVQSSVEYKGTDIKNPSTLLVDAAVPVSFKSPPIAKQPAKSNVFVHGAFADNQRISQ